MPFSARFQSLPAKVIFWIILPLTVVLIGIITISALTYQNIITRLVLERHQHLANVAAVSVSQVIDGYAHVLEALGSQSVIQNESQAVRESALSEASEALEMFSAGVMIVDQNGNVTNANSDLLATQGSTIFQAGFPVGLETMTSPAYSNVIQELDQGKELVLVAVPLFDEQGSVSGVVIGALDLGRAPFRQPILKLSEPSEGYVYLVDNQGIIISHPDPAEIGKKIQDRPLVQNAADAQNAEMLWKSPSGDRFVAAAARVSASGWSLVVQEPWEAVISTTRYYGVVILTISLLAVLLVSLLSWRGTGLVTAPIQKLVSQTITLSQGEPIESVGKSNIFEIDQLGVSFEEMARQIVAYRNGLRRYVGAITSSQEEERLRIARELHDEIIQNLLTISRKIELCQVTDEKPEQERLLGQLKDMTNQTMQEVRQISQDLRPMMLDDLGLVAAIRMLVQSIHEGHGAIPHANFRVTGKPGALNTEQDLALYRIVQEALTNVRKHACATGVIVELIFHQAEVRLVIQDDGKGFQVPPSMTELVQQGSLGLMGIQERVWAVEGKLSIESKPVQGTRIEITIPLAAWKMDELNREISGFA